jgi:hypothetical protein
LGNIGGIMDFFIGLSFLTILEVIELGFGAAVVLLQSRRTKRKLGI